MKKIAVVVAAILSTVGSSAIAADVTRNVNVTVSLTSVCRVTTAGLANTLDFGTYTAFGAASTPTPSTVIALECTRGLSAPTTSFDGANNFGTAAGLNYELSTAVGAVTAGTAATAVSGGVGSADTRNITVSGTMASGQAGTNGASGTSARVLTITY